MKTTIIAALLGLCLTAANAEARAFHPRKHAKPPSSPEWQARRSPAGAISEAGGYQGSGPLIISVQTAAGEVRVAASFAQKIVPFITEVVARGFRGRVNCHASKGHVPGSLHYRGEACDFAQRGWGKTVAVMYRVGDLAAAHGLRDGCSFQDCGHIDSGAVVQARRSSIRAAYVEATPLPDSHRSW